MHRICVAIWETGEWSEEWTFSTFIPLPKKGDLKQCANYRTIAFVFHASETLLRIILKKIRVKTETEIADEQVGFRQEIKSRISEYRCTRHASTNNNNKAFDSISHDKLRVTMMDMGYSLHLINLLAKLYRKQLAKVKAAGTLSELFRVKRGV